MIIAWFSCGATSAVACKLALLMFQDVRICYIETGTGHPDNERFIRDCERWYGQKIEILRSEVYKSVDDVLMRKRYINGPHGAACTLLLKKQVRYKFEDEVKEWDGQVWGFDYCKREVNRAIRFRQQNPGTKPLFPLIDKRISKQDALGMLKKAGIEIPAMYKLGYANNNCIGCVKGGIGYWNKIRRDFPDRFWCMAKIERLVGASCLKDENGRVWLDELDPKRGDVMKEITPECSIICEVEFQYLMDKQTEGVMSGVLDINDTI